MGVLKSFKNAIDEAVDAYADELNPAPPVIYTSPRITGDTGTVEEFRAMLADAEKGLKKKSDAYTQRKNRTTNKAHMAYNAFSKAHDELNALKQGFVTGAQNGFYFSRVKNLQAILAAPDEFAPVGQPSQSFAAATLIEAMKRSRNPDEVPALALAAASGRNKQLILNEALEKMTQAPADEKSAAVITALKNANAGAPVPDENAKIMIRAQNAPKKLILGPTHRFQQ